MLLALRFGKVFFPLLQELTLLQNRKRRERPNKKRENALVPNLKAEFIYSRHFQIFQYLVIEYLK
jgi:hypothetical protein